MQKIKPFEGQELLEQAERFATIAHAKQTRWDGSPYIEHPRAVAAKLSQPLLKAAGWCHDIAEDCYSDWETAYKALSGAGIDKDVIALVRHLTRAKDMSYADYIAHIGRNIDACRVKLADLEHNLETLKHEPRNNQRRDKYMLAHLYLKHIVEDARLTANE